MFISAANQLGMVESGLVAAVTSATFAVVAGGVSCVAVVAAMTAGIPSLRCYRIDDATNDEDSEIAAS